MTALKLTLVGMVAVVGAVLWSGVHTAPKAEAEPHAAIGLNSGICITLSSAFGGLSGTDPIKCLTIDQQTEMQNIVKCLRGPSSPTLQQGDQDPILVITKRCLSAPEILQLYGSAVIPVVPEDFAVMDRDLNQFHEGQRLIMIAFVNDDAPVRFTTTKGQWFLGLSVSKEYICDTGAEDPDCDGNPATQGDGVVAALLDPIASEGLGDGVATAVQEGIGFPMDFTVVGKPVRIELTPLFGKDVISTGATPPTKGPSLGSGPFDTPGAERVDSTDCNFEGSVEGVLGAVAQPMKTVIIARAFDNDDNQVVGAFLEWDRTTTVPALEQALVTRQPLGPAQEGAAALPQTPTIDLGGTLGIGFPQFVCGFDEPGELKLNVTFNATVVDNSAAAPPASLVRESVSIEVIDAASRISLAADPPQLDCNGTNTSKVTATVTNSAGGPAANGTDVNFSVVALGIANPLRVDTADGVASTTITPLAGAAGVDPRGVTVNTLVLGERDQDVVANSFDPRVGSTWFAKTHGRQAEVRNSILVRCTGAIAAPAAPPAGAAGAGGAPGGRISGPDTGSGGHAVEPRALSLGSVIALTVGAGALAAGGGVARRRR